MPNDHFSTKLEEVLPKSFKMGWQELCFLSVSVGNEIFSHQQLFYFQKHNKIKEY